MQGFQSFGGGVYNPRPREYLVTKTREADKTVKLAKAVSEMKYIKVSLTPKADGTTPEKTGGLIVGTANAIHKNLTNSRLANYGYIGVSFGPGTSPSRYNYRLYGSEADIRFELSNPVLGLDQARINDILSEMVTATNWESKDWLKRALEVAESNAAKGREDRTDFIHNISYLRAVDEIAAQLHSMGLHMEPRRGGALIDSAKTPAEQAKIAAKLIQGGLLNLVRKANDKPNELVVDVSRLDPEGSDGKGAAKTLRRSKLPAISPLEMERLRAGENPNKLKVGILNMPYFPIVSNDDFKWNRAMDILARVTGRNEWLSFKDKRGKMYPNGEGFTPLSFKAIIPTPPESEKKKKAAQPAAAPMFSIAAAPAPMAGQMTFQQAPQPAPAQMTFQQAPQPAPTQMTFAPAPQPAPTQLSFAPAPQPTPAPTQLSFAPAPQPTPAPQPAPTQLSFAPAPQPTPAPTLSSSPRAVAAATSAPPPASIMQQPQVAITQPAAPSPKAPAATVSFAPAPTGTSPSTVNPLAFAPAAGGRFERPATIQPGGVIGSPRGTVPPASRLPQ